jgi:hypothetical protein
MSETLNSTDQNSAEVVRGAGASDQCHLGGTFFFECFDKDGNLKWTETAENVVTNQGKGGMMNSYLDLSPALPAAWYMSLITNGTAISTSTYATPTVTEITSSIVATRPTVAWTAWSSTNSASIAATTTAFSVIGTATIIGNMLVTAVSSGSIISNTTGSGGILFSSSSFTGGSKNVSSGDTLNVSYSLSI